MMERYDGKATRTMIKTRLPAALSLLAAILCLACLPACAQAQFSFVIDPAVQSAAPGTNTLTFSGTLSNTGQTALTSDKNPAFNLLTGPAGVDLTTFPVYLDNFFAPATLNTGQTQSQIFSVNIDPAAGLGQYTGNISFGYGGHVASQDNITVNVAPAAVPEAGTLPLLALGCAFLGLKLRRKRPDTSAR